FFAKMPMSALSISRPGNSWAMPERRTASSAVQPGCTCSRTMRCRSGNAYATSTVMVLSGFSIQLLRTCTHGVDEVTRRSFKQGSQCRIHHTGGEVELHVQRGLACGITERCEYPLGAESAKRAVHQMHAHAQRRCQFIARGQAITQASLAQFQTRRDFGVTG